MLFNCTEYIVVTLPGSRRTLVESPSQFVNVICKAGSLAVRCTDMRSKGTVRSPVDLGSEDSL